MNRYLLGFIFYTNETMLFTFHVQLVNLVGEMYIIQSYVHVLRLTIQGVIDNPPKHQFEVYIYIKFPANQLVIT